MGSDTITIIIIIIGSLVFVGFVALFSIIFHRKLAVIKKDNNQEDPVSERLTSAPLSDAEIAYTTENVQPTSNVAVNGYPHEQLVATTLPQQKAESDSSDETVGDPDVAEVAPTLTILIRYDRQRNYLLLRLLNLFDLPVRRDKTEVNSFIEIRLLPNFGQNPIQTDVYIDSSNPKLDETFEFEIDSDELRLQKLEFVVMDAREYSNKSIGCAVLDIDSLNMNDLMAEKEINKVLAIDKPRIHKSLSQISLDSSAESGGEMSYAYSMTEGLNIEEHDQSRKTKATVRLTKDWEYVAGMDPMILISLHYAKESAKLVLAVIKVSNLKTFPNGSKPDPYVKVHIYIRKKIKLKKKTVVKKQELNPVYNQKLEFPLPEKDLEAVKLVLAVKNNVPTRGVRSRPGSLHEISFGDSSSGSCLEHWRAAVASNKPVAKWHTLSGLE